MGNPKRKMKIIFGVIRDTTAMTKAFLSTKRAASIARVAIIRATAHHNPSVPPSEGRVIAVLSLEQVSRQGACFATQALIDRLRRTRDASVAMKCLHIFHRGLQMRSFVVKDKLSSYSANGGWNFLNMATFWDKSDTDAWELSSWVRWYASVIEQEFAVSRVLKSSFTSKVDTATKEKREKQISMSATDDLIKEIDVLITFAEIISNAPASSSSEEKALVVESLGLVSDDYDATQKDIVLRINEIDDRVVSLSYDELSRVLEGLKRVQACKKRLGLLFVHRKKHEAFWETVEVWQQKFTVEKMEKEKEMQVAVIGTSRVRW